MEPSDAKLEPLVERLGVGTVSNLLEEEFIALRDEQFKGGAVWSAVLELLRTSEHLEMLDLSHADVSDEGLKELADVLEKGSCRLEILLLSGPQVGDRGAEHLAGAIKAGNARLRLLGLRETRVGDKGAEHLAAAIREGNTRLTELGLINTRVGDRGAEHLAAAVSEGHMRHGLLNLGGTQVSDRGVEHLVAAINGGRTRLRTLQIYECEGVTDEGAERLALAVASNPNLSLERMMLQGTSASLEWQRAPQAVLDAMAGARRLLSEGGGDHAAVEQQQLQQAAKPFVEHVQHMPRAVALALALALARMPTKAETEDDRQLLARLVVEVAIGVLDAARQLRMSDLEAAEALLHFARPLQHALAGRIGADDWEKLIELHEQATGRRSSALQCTVS